MNTGRKFTVVALAIALGAFLEWHGKFSSVYATFLGSVVSAYLAANVTQKVVQK